VPRLMAALGRGIWEFLVGDTPEFLVATAAIVGLAFAVHQVRVLAYVSLPATVVAVLAVSVGHGRRQIRNRGRGRAGAAEESA